MTLPKLLTRYLQSINPHQTIVLVTGVFDLLHQEHFNFLLKASQLADHLIIGIESDFRVSKLKGPHRPLNSQQTRRHHLLSLGLSDAVFTLPRHFATPQSHTNLLRLINPTFLAVSSHSPHLNQKQLLMEQIGGKLVVVHQHNPQLSSTQLVHQSLHPPIIQPWFNLQPTTGQGRGRTHTVPTLNFSPTPLPYKHGVYAGLLRSHHQLYPAAIHLGPVPTFSQTASSLEVHLIDPPTPFPHPPYSLRLVSRIRPIKKFASSSALKHQIHRDLVTISTLLKTHTANPSKDE